MSPDSQNFPAIVAVVDGGSRIRSGARASYFESYIAGRMLSAMPPSTAR